MGASVIDEAEQAGPSPEAPDAVWRVPSHVFRSRQAGFFLSPAQRAAVARRRRFYSMPYLRRADKPNPDDLLP